MIELLTPEIITGLVTGGIVGPLGVLATAIRHRRVDFNKARREHIADLESWRDKIEADYRTVHEYAVYWQSVSADYAYQLRSHGIEPTTTALRPVTMPDRSA